MAPFSIIPTALLSILSLASAFPSLPLDERLNVVPFDPTQQYVSNKGEHKYIAPGEGDSRSPCPALNVMANHGYIPRNGFVTLLQIQKALPEVFGLSSDLTSVLSLIFLSGTKKGDQYDIGGFPRSLIGETPYQFIQTYEIGNINSLNPMEQICEKYNAINGSKYHHKDFFSMGGDINDELFFRAFANKSAAYPLGNLNKETKLSMLAMTPKGDGTFHWNKFQNAIPDNWYKSNILAPFSTAVFASDLALQQVYGCLPGETYKGIEMSKLTNGAFTNEALQDPTTNLCFLSQAAPLVLPALAKQPEFTESTRRNVATAVSEFQKGLKSIDCSAHVLKSIDMGLLGEIFGLRLL